MIIKQDGTRTHGMTDALSESSLRINDPKLIGHRLLSRNVLC